MDNILKFLRTYWCGLSDTERLTHLLGLWLAIVRIAEQV